MKKIQEGFNVVELIITMAVIAVMVAITGPMLVQQIPKWHMNGTARDVAAKLMMVRMRAIQENNQYGVRFELGDIDRYHVEKYDDTNSVWVYGLVSGASYSDIDVEVESCISGNRVIFFPNGRGIDEDGITTCPAGTDGAPDRKILTITTLAGTSLLTTIDINPFTGQIEVN
jgi:prepilin-type N-terminal cleavage/methylation domain-containing protein